MQSWLPPTRSSRLSAPRPLPVWVCRSPSISMWLPAVLLFGICTTGTVNPPGGDPNSGCLAPNTLAFYTGPAANTTSTATARHHHRRGHDGTAAGLSGCLVEVPSCFLAAAGTTVVGFEDIANQGLGDADFNDLVFSFTNVTTISEPGTMGLLALSLVGLSGAGLVRRRSAKRNQ